MMLNRNSDYFMGPDWELVVFQVEDELFRVPKYHFARNPHPPFKDMFSLPQSPSDSFFEGKSEEKPIVLEQISKVDFEAFLSVLYPRYPKTVFQGEYITKTWLSVLRLASMWNFLALRKLAIYRLSLKADFSTFDRILVAREFGVPQFFLDGVITFVLDTSQEIADPEGQKLGLSTALALYRFRGKIWPKRIGSSVSYYDVKTAISDNFEEIFGAGMRGTADMNDAYDQDHEASGTCNKEVSDLEALYEAIPTLRSAIVNDLGRFGFRRIYQEVLGSRYKFSWSLTEPLKLDFPLH
ncbi:hypothetical protein V5O48_011088 [Marasmius crinis-equi]|uniref:BTB domain-containing protein n=1 Tax=Marasmius crinis-equi TaxID=585013 RepID=A0ABR3F6L8_9AGAR